MANKKQSPTTNPDDDQIDSVIDSVRMAYEAMQSLHKFNGIYPAAPETPGDTGNDLMYETKLRKAFGQALLQNRLKRLTDEATAKVVALHLKDLQKQEDAKTKAEKKTGYEEARKLINSGAINFPSTPAEKTNSWVASGRRSGTTRRLTLTANGTPQVIEKENLKGTKLKEILNTDETTKPTAKTPSPFDPAKWVTGEPQDGVITDTNDDDEYY